jgi:hypothetical protein
MPMRCSHSTQADRWQSVTLAQLRQQQGKDCIRVSGIAMFASHSMSLRGKSDGCANGAVLP